MIWGGPVDGKPVQLYTRHLSIDGQFLEKEKRATKIVAGFFSLPPCCAAPFDNNSTNYDNL